MVRRVLCLLIILTQLAACATVPIGRNGDARYQAAAGEQVSVSLKDGQQQLLRVARVDANEICAESYCIPMSNIMSIRPVQPEAVESRNWPMILGIGLLVLAIAAGSRSKSGCSGPNPYNLPPGTAIIC